MQSLKTLITDMRETRDTSHSNAQIATHPAIKAIAETYAELMTNYIIRLEEINRINNFCPTNAYEILHLESMLKRESAI